MATAYHNLSEYDFNSVPNAENMKFGIVVIRMEFQYYRSLIERRSQYIKKTWSETNTDTDLPAFYYADQLSKKNITRSNNGLTAIDNNSSRSMKKVTIWPFVN